MTKRQKPQSTESHLYDKKALNYLKSVFPEHWKYIPVGDEDSQIEYGQDRIVQLTDADDQLDGAEFRVQNKGTRRSITKYGIRISIAVTTLNYLHALPLPVLLHFYHIPTETGYWLWLDDLFSQSKPAEWQAKPKIPITIPTINKLDGRSAKLIEHHVLSLCRLQALIKHARSETANDPHYSWDLELRNNSITINQNPKHTDGPPMTVNQDISNDLRELLIKAWETGVTIHLNGQLPFQGVPDWVHQIFEGKEIELFRTPPKRVIYSQFRFYKHVTDEKPFYDTGPIEMQFKRQGSKVSVVEGMDSSRAIIFILSVDLQNVQQIGNHFKIDGGLSITPDPNTTDIILLDECCDFIEQAMLAEKVEYYAPLEQMSIPLQPVRDVQSQIYREFVHTLADIQRRLGLIMSIPEMPNENQFRIAKFVAHVFETGRAPLLLDWVGNGPRPEHLHLLITIDSEDRVKDVLSDISAVDEELILPGAPQFQVEILDRQVQLGSTEHVIKAIKCLNADDLHRELSKKDVLGKTLDIFWEVDWDVSYTRFPDFSNDPSNE